MKNTTLEKQLAHLDTLAHCDDQDQLTTELKKTFKKKSPYLIAKAASLVEEKQIDSLTDDLLQVFDRLIKAPAKSDPGCTAKTAIVDAFIANHQYLESTYLTAAHHTQFEPVFGGRIDTAGPLRCAGVNGLITIGYPDILNEIAELLCDSDRSVRATAAQIISQLKHDSAEPLLRLAIKSCEKDADVLLEMFSAILNISPQTGLIFTVSFLNDTNLPERSNSAAIALGQSKLPAAYEPLLKQFERELDQHYRETLLLAIAMLRLDEANNFLCSLIKHSDERTAELAIRALGIYYYDSSIKQAVLDAASDRNELSAILQELFL